jgi:hypothetical protein
MSGTAVITGSGGGGGTLLYTLTTTTNGTHVVVSPPITNSTTLGTMSGALSWHEPDPSLRPGHAIPDNFVGAISMPDGSIIDIDRGNFRVLDKDAKVTYRGSRVREFNRYINASDLLAEFVEFLGAERLTEREALKIPIELFVAWMIVRAAEQDGEDAAEGDRLRLASGAQIARSPRCRCCGRFIARRRARNGVLFCSGDHQERWLAKEV